ncbi:MAG: polysaccharide biosynthesis C-terminal domain-containing protein, partial [Cyanobacteria bacterium P01_D01_bin.116]
SLIALPVFLGVVTLANELVINIFGEKWELSIPIMQILAFGGIFNLIMFFNQSVFLAIGKPFWPLRLDILNVFFNTIACIISVRWGILAVAFAYIISDFLVIPASLWSLKRLINISLKTYSKQLVSPFICAITMASLTWFTKHWLEKIVEPQLIFLLICTLCGVAFYILSLRLLAPLLFQELWDLASLGLFTSQEKNS